MTQMRSNTNKIEYVEETKVKWTEYHMKMGFTPFIGRILITVQNLGRHTYEPTLELYPNERTLPHR